MPYAIRPPDPVDPLLVDPTTRDEVERRSFDIAKVSSMDDLLAQHPEDKIKEITDHLNRDPDLDAATRAALSCPGVYVGCLEEYLKGRSKQSIRQAKPATAAAKVVELARTHGVPALIRVTVDRIGQAEGVDLAGIREELVRELRSEGLRTGPGEPRAQVLAHVERRLAPSRAGAQSGPGPGLNPPTGAVGAPRARTAAGAEAGQWGSSWRRSCEVAGESLDDDPTDPQFIQPSPQSDLVHAAAHLMYIAAIEEMGLIRAFEQLVARFSKGMGEYPDDDWISNVLYCLHQGDERLMPVEERRLLMAATLGIVPDGLPSGAAVNGDFPRLFGQLVDELLKLREDRCRCRRGFDESTDAVEFVKLALEANIQAYMTGIALMQVRDLSRQVRLIKQVMQRPAVITQFACGHRDGLWAAVNNLNSGHYGSIGRLLALHQVALARNDIFNWIEPFDGSTASLDEAIEGAVTIRTAESWYAARPAGARYELPRRGAPAELGVAVKDRAATAV